MTQPFTQHVCWSRAGVEETVNTEAVHADRAVFLATHQPLVVVRGAWNPSDADEQVNEQDVLDDFAHRRPVGGVVLMPIIGESGTGKSHLVRWVQQHLPNTPTRRVIYLRKTETSLSSVIDALLADLDDPKFEDVRNRVSRGMGQYDERRLPHELLDRLALAVQFAAPPQHPGSDEQARMRAALVSERGLPTLLRDYEYRQHLLAPGSFLARFAAELRHGRRGGEGERPAAFSADDLKADVDSTEIGPVALGIYRQLIARPELREEAARLLTVNLDGAVLRLTDLDGGRLAETMRDIRREFHRRGQEIVLLVEDFALIQGVQRDLLDAISETGVREGGQELATIRTLMAVTRGYFDSLLDTVKTRVAASIPYVYRLDAPMGDGPVGVGDQHVVDFVARYLNAARTGAAALECAYDQTGGSGNWVPNACGPCRFQKECHEAFGQSSEGFGLYPFNRSAVLRAIQVSGRDAAEFNPRRILSRPAVSQAIQVSGRDAAEFNPRRILSRVVRHVLDNYDTTIRDGAFPPRAFRKDFPRTRLDGRQRLAAAVEAQLLRVDPENYERRVDLLDFWGESAAGGTSLAAGIHEAFQLPLLTQQANEDLQRAVGVGGVAPAAREQAVAPAVAPAARGDAPATPSAQPARSVRDMKLDHIEAWYGQGKVLPQDLARNLRAWIRNAVIARVPWDDLGLPRPTDVAVRRAVLNEKHGNAVTIEAAFGEKGAAPPGKATIELRREPVTAAMLEAIVQREECGHWNFPGGPAQQRLLSRRLDEWAASMVEAVREHLGLHRPETITAAVEASLLGARLLNLPGSGSEKQEDLLTVLFDPGPGDQAGGATREGNADGRVPEWTRLVDKHRGVRADLVAGIRQAVGIAQGRGGSQQLVDATVLLPAVDAFVGTWRLGSSAEALPEWLETAHGHLRREFDAALDAQWATLREMADEYRRLTGGVEPDLLLQELKETCEAILPIVGENVKKWRGELERARTYPWAEWQRLARDLREPGPPGPPGPPGSPDPGDSPGAPEAPDPAGDSPGDAAPTGGATNTSNTRRLRVVAADRGEHFSEVLLFLRRCNRWLDGGLRNAERERTTQPADLRPDLRRALTEIGTLLDTWRETRNG